MEVNIRVSEQSRNGIASISGYLISFEKDPFPILFCYFCEYYVSHDTTKCVFGSFWPGQTQTGLLSYRS